MGHNFENLKTHILAMSEADHWNAALEEWKLEYVEVPEEGEEREPEHCPCGHYPIIELCWLRNQQNGRSTFVGNVCVKKFMGIDAGTVADGLKRIAADTSKALNVAATKYAHERGWINNWERGFCLDTARKRKLSGRQLDKRIQINETVMAKTREMGKHTR